MAQKKLVDSLSIKHLKVEFYVGTIDVDGKEQFVNKLQTAINDGILHARLQDSANTYLNGDIAAAVNAMRKCLASYKVNMPKAAANGSYVDVRVENERIKTLQGFLDSYATNTKRKNSFDNTRPLYDITDEEIELLAGDYRKLKSTYDSMASKMTKDLSDLHPGDELYAVKLALRDRLYRQFGRVSELYSAAKKATRLENSPEGLSLLAKLQRNKATTLSKAESELIQKLLSK